jgi:hypothetical protein
VARECAAVMFKEFALQDAGTLESTQLALVSQSSIDGYPLCDQEILVRHLHHTVGRWVDRYRSTRSTST